MRLGDEVADKPGRLVGEACSVRIVEEVHPYAGRGGLKLEYALKDFDLSVDGKTGLDLGASTGGFTDCLLQNGAAKVFAVDVGYGQLDWKLRSDPRVVAMDRKNARHLTLDDLGQRVDVAVIDVSFISLKRVVPPAIAVLKQEGDLVALVKPQFEVGKDEVENKGIIKDPQKHLKVLLDLRAFMQEQGWPLIGLAVSPITGQKGNREFLIHCVAGRRALPLSEDRIRGEVLR